MRDIGKVGVAAWGLACVVAGCAHTSAPGKGPSTHPRDPSEKQQVVLGPEAVNHGPDVLAAWLAYGAARAAAYEKTPPPPSNTSADDYPLEFAGRTAQSQHWKQSRSKGAPAFPLLDRQVAIWEAGFLPELLVSVYARPGWTVPGATIRGLRMQAFAKRFTGDYDNTPAVVVIPASGAKFPSVPGGDFPDPEQVPVGPESCGRLPAERAAAWRRWEALEPQLRGIPIAAADSMQFAGALDRVKDDPVYLERGATWVAWRVGSLALLEGFCAVETRDWPRAVDMLTRAVAMLPQETLPRLELGISLSMVKRYDEALAQDRAVIEHSTDGCTIATALRHQGYTFIDMGLLDSARLAYEKSLEVDPTSALAAHELKVIAQDLSKRHANPKGAGNYVPPPLSRVSITKCKRQAP